MKLRRLFLFTSCWLLFLLGLVFKQWPDSNIHLFMCDVGQGDAILITHGFYQILIDTGFDESALACLIKHVPIWDRKLELVVVTHSDNDHSGGYKSVSNQYFIANIIANPATIQKLTVLGLLKALPMEEQAQPVGPANLTRFLKPQISECVWVDHKLNFCLVSPDLNQTESISLDLSAAETILSAEGSNLVDEVEDNNSESIVLFGHLDEVGLALMADLPAEAELALFQKGLIEEVEILKVAHHGSKNSTNNTVVQKMLPEISLLSVGKNNRYGHPAPEILKTLTDLGSKIYRTDKDGEVEVVIANHRYWVSHK